MRIKSYFARAVEDAVSQARLELGAEAMLVNSRKSPPEARHMGEYEVVFAVPPSVPNEPAPAETPVAENPLGDRIAREVAELRKQLEGMRKTLARPAPAAPQWLALTPEVSDAYTVLTANDISPELARDLVHGANSRMAGSRVPGTRMPARPDTQSFQKALVEEMLSRCSAKPTLGQGNQRPAIVGLVGPPGAGKTSTLVKLAVNYGLAGRRPVALISTDTYRVAAAEQLRSYAAILGVAFQVIETPGTLAQAIEESRSKDLILIDTPGLGFGDLDAGADLARFISTREDIDCHLVLSASMKTADLTRVVDSYEIFRPQRLIFTRVDETSSFGPVFNEVVRTGKPVSFFGTGQRIPEDLEAASSERLIDLVLGARSGQVVSAA